MKMLDYLDQVVMFILILGLSFIGFYVFGWAIAGFMMCVADSTDCWFTSWATRALFIVFGIAIITTALLLDCSSEKKAISISDL